MTTDDRLHALDAVRAFALLLGVVFHAGFSFLPGMLPGVWAIVDTSPSTTLSVLLFTSHIFRMSLFFFIAGFFGRMLVQRQGTAGFWANRATRIMVPLIVGWLVLAPALAAVWIWGLHVTFAGTLPAAPVGAPSPPPGAFPLGHLWFLYYLLWLYVGVMLARTLQAALDRQGRLARSVDAAVCCLVRYGVAAPVLAAPTAVALYTRPEWFMWFGIPTPDQSLIPQGTSVVAYGTAVAFGWLVHRQRELLALWARQWPAHLAVALASTGLCLAIGGVAPAFVPAVRTWQTAVYAGGYALAIWAWTFAILGVALRYLQHRQPVVRYLADASYWMYLVHLPVVVGLQVVVGHLPWHWTLKFPVVVVTAFVALLVSYALLVRATYLGTVLNGRRHPRWGTTVAEQVDARDDSTNQVVRDQPVARLSGVHKRYGSVTAIDGLDLDVAPGQVLAVLGPNGAGKSTAIAVWLGLVQPDAGAATLFGRSPHEVSSRRGVGVMMQDITLTAELRVRELIQLTSSYYPAPLSLDDTLDVTRTRAIAGLRYSTLSGGQKRQVQFALAVCGNPALLFLDEPTVGLDIDAREALWDAIRRMVERGRAVVLTTHYLDEAEALADRVAVLAAGRLIASGTVDDIRALVSRTHISCSTSLTDDEVRAWPDVVSARHDARRLQITTADAEAVVRRLLAADGAIRNLEVRQAGLAEAFTELTRKVA